jgi:PQQ-dependent catabolism-associated beta-propeller protein
MKQVAFVVLAAAATFAAAEERGLVWISSEKDHAITLVDPRSLAVVGTVATCKRPRHMQKLSNAPQLLVACSDSDAADLIDLATRRSLRRIPLGEDPEIFDLSRDDRTAYVSSEEDATLHVVDLASGKLAKSVEVGKEPEGVKLAPDGRRVYVTSEVASMVHAIDLAGGRVEKSLTVGKRPRRLAFAAGGRELWVTNELSASASVIDTETLAVVATVEFAVKGMRPDDITPVGLVPSPDGRTMYIGLGRANHVAFVDVASRRVVRQVLVGKRAWGLALNRDGSRLYVANGLSDDMTVIDTASGRALKTVPVGRVPHTVVVDD